MKRGSSPSGDRPWAAAAFALAFLAYLPVLFNGFVDWDDPAFIVNNAPLRAFDLSWAFTTTLSGHWHPLTWLSLMLDGALWDFSPRGVHLTSLLLHAGSSALVFRIARRLLGAAPPQAALLASLLFAAHPLRAESVAWATERRDTLSAFFYLMTVALYLDKRLKPALAAYAASLMSKGMGVTLPAALLLLDWFPPRRAEKEGWPALIKEKLPFIALALAAGATGLLAQAQNGSLAPLSEYGLSARLSAAAYGLAFYPVKTLWPAGLAPLYPFPPDIALARWPYGPALIAAAGLSAWLWAERRERPAAWAAWLYFVLSLVPVSGLVRYGPQLAADRYSYLPCLGFALLAAGAWAGLEARYKAEARALAAAAVLALGTLSWAQAASWRNTETLWGRAFAAGRDSARGRHNLGNYLAARGRVAEAEAHYRRAVELDSGYAYAHNSLSLALARQGKLLEAVQSAQAAARLLPDYWEAHGNLGIYLAHLGRHAEAAASFEKALSLKPGKAELHMNYGLALATAGRKAHAVREFEEALRLKPGLASARAALAALKRRR